MLNAQLSLINCKCSIICLVVTFVVFFSFIRESESDSTFIPEDILIDKKTSEVKGDFSYAEIEISASPPVLNPIVYIDGKKIGSAPVSVRLAPGTSYDIEIRQGKKMGNTTIFAEAKEFRKVVINLKESLIDLIYVKGGKFVMGDHSGTGEKDETPLHEVTVSGFYIGKNEISRNEFNMFVRETGYKTDAETGGDCWTFDKGLNRRLGYSWRSPGFKQNDDHPAVCISWNDASQFARWISSKSGKKFRLPTEAEWEYAALGQVELENIKNPSYKKEKMDPGHANFCDLNCINPWNNLNENDGYGFTAPVGSYPPNSRGIYDLLGNVWEWCSDWYDPSYYQVMVQVKPGGPDRGKTKVVRGGSWLYNTKELRISNRSFFKPDFRSTDLGLRLVREF